MTQRRLRGRFAFQNEIDGHPLILVSPRSLFRSVTKASDDEQGCQQVESKFHHLILVNHVSVGKPRSFLPWFREGVGCDRSRLAGLRVWNCSAESRSLGGAIKPAGDVGAGSIFK